MANKTILVTGSTGWLGGKLCEALVARGITVVGLARRDTEVAGVMSVRADLATGAGLEKLEGLEFDCCVHLAAVAGWGALGDCLEGCEYAAMPPLFELIASGKIKVDQVLIELHHTKVGRRLRGDFGRTLQRFFAAADTAKLRITHKERNQWGCDGYRCVEYALVSEAFLREANGAVMCATEAA